METLRKELLNLLCHGNAHMTFEEVVADFPTARINERAPNMPYSPWHILEHMRIAQEDILRFVQEPDYESPPWPQGYFPSPQTRTDEAGWNKTIRDFLADRSELAAMAADPDTDLLKPLSHAPGYNRFRQIVLAADHNAYHTGELAFMRQVMQTWPAGGVLYDAEK
jgi:hypothetical protein